MSNAAKPPPSRFGVRGLVRAFRRRLVAVERKRSGSSSSSFSSSSSVLQGFRGPGRERGGWHVLVFFTRTLHAALLSVKSLLRRSLICPPVRPRFSPAHRLCVAPAPRNSAPSFATRRP